MVAGAALLAWSAGIHLDLWRAGFESIPTIGWLFLMQAVGGFAVALVVLVSRRLLPALAGVAMLASTIGGLVWSVEWGLFGFKDSFEAPFVGESLTVEAAGIAVLCAASVLRLRDARKDPAPTRRAARPVTNSLSGPADSRPPLACGDVEVCPSLRDQASLPATPCSRRGARVLPDGVRGTRPNGMA